MKKVILLGALSVFLCSATGHAGPGSSKLAQEPTAVEKAEAEVTRTAAKDKLAKELYEQLRAQVKQANNDWDDAFIPFDKAQTDLHRARENVRYAALKCDKMDHKLKQLPDELRQAEKQIGETRALVEQSDAKMKTKWDEEMKLRGKKGDEAQWKQARAEHVKAYSELEDNKTILKKLTLTYNQKQEELGQVEEQLPQAQEERKQNQPILDEAQKEFEQAKKELKQKGTTLGQVSDACEQAEKDWKQTQGEYEQAQWVKVLAQEDYAQAQKAQAAEPEAAEPDWSAK